VALDKLRDGGLTGPRETRKPEGEACAQEVAPRRRTRAGRLADAPVLEVTS
jgi:hypothetical protein